MPHGVDRATHAKATLAVDNAELRFLDLPDDLRAGFAQPGVSYSTVVRFSNASGTGRPDWKPDLRGVALRIHVSSEESHDLLMTNYPVSHARNARQFVEFAKATAGTRASQLLGIARLLRLYGPRETIRMWKNVMAGRRRSVSSVATETYWSRGAMRWGPTLAVRLLLRPSQDALQAPKPPTDDPSYLSTEAARRVAQGDVRMELCIQRYVSAAATPIEDTAIAWSEKISPPEFVAVLTIGQGDITTVDVLAQARVVDAIAFNPWNTTDEFRPLGNLNRARKAVYDASSAHRLGYRWESKPPLRNEVAGAAARGLPVREPVRRVAPVARPSGRPQPRGIPTRASPSRTCSTQRRGKHRRRATVPPSAPEEQSRVSRSFDGSNNDLSAHSMGAVGSAFGRNLPPSYRPNLFDQPNPMSSASSFSTVSSSYRRGR